MPNSFTTLGANPFTGEDPYKAITATPLVPAPTITPKPVATATGGLVASKTTTPVVSPAPKTDIKPGVSAVTSGASTTQAVAPVLKPIPTVTKTESINGGTLQYMSDGTQKFTPGTQKNIELLQPTYAPPTIDSAGASAIKSKLAAAPTLENKLGETDQAAIDADVQNKIAQLRIDSKKEIDSITKIGQGKLASSRSALATIGALGRTISGMPVETGLGALSEVQNGIDKAIAEERQNLQSKITEAESGGKIAAQTKLDKLNELSQNNWENALKFVQEDRNSTEAEKKSIVDDLNIKKLQSDLANDTSDKNVKTVTDQVERLAEGNVPLDQISAAQISDYEKKLGLPSGSFTNFYKAKTDYQTLATEENKLKLDKLRADLGKSAGSTSKLAEDLIKKGFVYIKTPKELTEIKKSGRTVQEVDGKSFVAPTKVIKGLKGSSTIVDSITNTPVSGGKASSGLSSGKPVNKTTPTSISKQYKAAINQALSSAVGADGKVHPADYAAAKKDWISKGGTPTQFDTQMRGYRNPDNPNYGVGK